MSRDLDSSNEFLYNTPQGLVGANPYYKTIHSTAEARKDPKDTKRIQNPIYPKKSHLPHRLKKKKKDSLERQREADLAFIWERLNYLKETFKLTVTKTSLRSLKLSPSYSTASGIQQGRNSQEKS